MAPRDEIVGYANALLDVDRWPEFGMPGLQVVGADEVTTIACGVSCSRALFEEAVGLGAELVLVHHGLFWRSEPLLVDVRMRGRLEALFRGNCSLAAYHLPLDAHPTLGNNAQLAGRIGAEPDGPFAEVGLGCAIGSVTIAELTRRVREAVGRDPLVLPFGPDEIRRVAICTGSAGHELIRAAREGYDALLTGEPEEPNFAAAQELGIHLLAAGHHATERFGVQALTEHLAGRFELEWHYVEADNPI